MRNFTRSEVGGAGHRPAQAQNVSIENSSRFSESVQCCSVEIAKVLPSSGDASAEKVGVEGGAGKGGESENSAQNAPQCEESARTVERGIPEEEEQPNDGYGKHLLDIARLEEELEGVERAKQETIRAVRARVDRAEARVRQLEAELRSESAPSLAKSASRSAADTTLGEDGVDGVRAWFEVDMPRTCSVPGCDTLLGEDVVHAMCAVHRRIRDKCARKGCARQRVGGSIWCAGHRACDASVSSDNLPAVEDTARNAYFEEAWQGLAENSDLDPVTVAACKELRDLEAMCKEICVSDSEVVR